MTDKYKNNYLRLIKQYLNGNNKCFPKHKVFEILSAIDLDMILWDDLPPDFDTKFTVPHKMDYGIDLVSLDYNKSCQVKLYNENSRITWKDYSTFYTYSKNILNIDNMILYTTPVAKLDTLSTQGIQNDNNIQVIRKDFDELIKTYSDNINQIDCLSDTLLNSPLEERYYLLECYNIFNESTDSQLYFQLPCGCGKSYIMLYILREYIQENPISKHIIFCPWIDLAKQMYDLFIKNNIKTDFIGDGKHTITESSNVIICINMSVSHIPNDIDITYKIIDEAHHLESEDSQIRKQIDKLECTKELNLSATFKNQDILDFNYPMDEAITDGYISDYQMVIGYFETGDKTDELVSLIKNHPEWCPMFVYFNSTERSKDFNNKLKKVDINSTYLTGDTSSTERERTKKDIENDKLQVVCLCGVYNEGVSIDCLQTVVFGDLRHSQINKIQIAMRANRKYSCKPFYRVVLPVVESDFSEKDIQDLIKTFAEIDPRLVEDIRNKNERRIKIIMNGDSNDTEVNLEKAELLYEQVYNRFGELVEGMSPEEIWFMKFERLKAFIDENGRRPTDKRNNVKEKQCGRWLQSQIHCYKNKKSYMNNENIYNTWTVFIHDPKYRIYFKSDEEKWYENFEKVKEFIDEHNKIPSYGSDYKNTSVLGRWYGSNKHKYYNKIGIMVDNVKVYNSWTEFINNPKYSKYLKSINEIWFNNLTKLKTFINNNKEKPLPRTDKELHRWMSTQIQNYKNSKNNMKDTQICQAWVDFVTNINYRKYFVSNEDIWLDNLAKLKKFIDINNTYPTENTNKTLSNWKFTQVECYINKSKIMKNIEIYNIFTEFINNEKYKQYFMSNNDKWFNNFNKLQIFINENKAKPTKKTDNILADWLANQVKYYKEKGGCMKNQEIYDKWTSFINDPKYNKYFKTHDDIWLENFNKLKDYMNKYHKRPIKTIDNETTILATWLQTQISCFNKKIKNMKSIEKYTIWKDFITNSEYAKYLKTDKDKWYDNLNLLKDYIDNNKKLPTNHSKISEEKYIATFLTQNKRYYIDKTYQMKEPDVYNTWTQFINDDNYIDYLKTNEDIWFDNFSKLKKFIDTYKKKPTKTTDTGLRGWLSTQVQNYKNKTYIMNTNDKIYNTWTQFIEDYKQYDIWKESIEININYINNNLKTPDEKWLYNFNRLKEYIDENNKKPTKISNNSLASWLSNQLHNYKNKTCIMKTNNIFYNKWGEFINDSKYIDYFKSNEEIWYIKLNNLKEFINKYGKTPIQTGAKDIYESQLGSWTGSQKNNYNKKLYIMKDEKIYQTWTEFVNNPIYRNYFKTDKEIWFEKLDILKEYIDTYNKRPRCSSKNLKQPKKIIGKWLSHQRENYKKQTAIMKDPEIYAIWTQFMIDYNHYF